MCVSVCVCASGSILYCSQPFIHAYSAMNVFLFLFILQTHCITVSASVAPLEGTDIPVFYYHFPGVYNDDFPLLELLAELSTVCPNLVGAKVAGVTDMAVVRAASAIEAFGVLGTGLSALATHPRGWVCYPWEAPAGRDFVADGVTDADAESTTLAMLRKDVGAMRVPIRDGA